MVMHSRIAFITIISELWLPQKVQMADQNLLNEAYPNPYTKYRFYGPRFYTELKFTWPLTEFINWKLTFFYWLELSITLTFNRYLVYEETTKSAWSARLFALSKTSCDWVPVSDFPQKLLIWPQTFLRSNLSYVGDILFLALKFLSLKCWLGSSRLKSKFCTVETLTFKLESLTYTRTKSHKTIILAFTSLYKLTHQDGKEMVMPVVWLVAKQATEGAQTWATSSNLKSLSSHRSQGAWRELILQMCFQDFWHMFLCF